MRNEKGLASVVVVTVLTVLITLISLGFTRIMDRSVNNSQNNQASNVATYGAQSAINDLAAYITDKPTVYSKNCTGSSSLIGSSTSPGPFYNNSNLSGDSSRTVQYTCLLVNQTPSDIVYQQLPSNKSRIIKMTTSAYPGSLDKIMLSWQPTDSQITGYPPSGNSLLDKSAWNDPFRNYLPVLRATLYPVPASGSIAALQAKSKTVFLYPRSGSGPVPTQSYTSLADGSLLPVSCTNSLDSSSFNGTADYSCNLIINNLSTAALPEQVDYFYVRIMPIYNQANVKIKANDIWGQSVNFVKVQAVLDTTAKSANVAKRLQARVDISSSDPAAPDENISPSSDSAPDYAVRSAGAICKRLQVFNTPYNYTQIDGPPGICNQLSGGSPIIFTPAPTLTLSINGIDSAAQTPTGSGYTGVSYIAAGGNAALHWVSTDSANYCNASANPSRAEWSGDKNPSSTWTGSTGTGDQTISNITGVTAFKLSCSGPGNPNPLEKTVTAWPPPTANISDPGPVQAGNSFTITWSANNASQCQFSGNWSPAIPSRSNPSGAPISGSQTIATDWDDTSARSYTITCHDPSDPNRVATYTRNLVVTWPTPTPSISGPASITAGNSFTLSWSVGNSSTCSTSGPWTTPFSLSGLKGQPRSGSQTIYTSWNDNKTQTYTITCSNPASTRSATWTVGPGGNTSKNPPNCSASISHWDNGNGTGGWSWNGACPNVSPASGYYQLINCQNLTCGYVGNAATQSLGTGSYCNELIAGADPWGWLADSGRQCWTIYPPLTITNFSNDGVWDQGPECKFPNPKNPYHSYDKTWWCRNGRFPKIPQWTTPGCVDGVHRWTTCNVHWTTTGGSGTVNCTGSVVGYGNFASSSWGGGGDSPPKDTGSLGWINAWLVTGYMYLDCTDSAGQSAHAGPI